MSQHSLMIISDRPGFLAESAAAFKKADASGREIVTVSFANANAKLHSLAGVSMVYVDLSAAAASCATLVTQLTDLYPSLPIVGIGQPTDASLIINLVKVGVKDFINYPLDAAELKAVMAKNAAVTDAGPARPQGRLITVCSPKGGTGVTLFATNLAITIAKKTASRVVICDPSDQCGDVATYLNLTPKYTIRDILDNENSLDASLVQGVLLPHNSGIQILAAARSEQSAPSADNLSQMKTLVSLLRSLFDVTIVDGGSLNPILLQYILSESDTVLLMGNPDVVSVKGLIIFYNKMRTARQDTSKVRVVINRYNSKSQIDAKEFERVTKHPISFYLPNNYPLCIEAVNAGEPLPDRSDLAHIIADIAHSIVPTAAGGSAPPSSKRGVLRCFL